MSDEKSEFIKRFLSENPGYESRFTGVIAAIFENGKEIGALRARLNAFADEVANHPRAVVEQMPTGEVGVIRLPFGDGFALEMRRSGDTDWVPKVVKL